MRHIEVSKKIALKRAVKSEELKQVLLDRLGQSCGIEKVSEGSDFFHVTATTGSPASMTRDARLDLDVSIRTEQDTARIIISGFAKVAVSKQVFYLMLVVLLLLAGLLPGFFETMGESSTSMDAIVFMLFGAFIIFDINGKLSEPREHLMAALESIDTTFG